MASLFFRSALFAALLLLPGAAEAHETKAGALTISDMWTMAPPKSAAVAAGFMKIANAAVVPDRLLGASSPAAAHVEVHDMTTENGVMKMREMKEGLIIPANGAAELKSGGAHLMFMGLKAPLNEGEMLKVTVNFEKAGKVDLELHVRAPGSKEDHAH